MKKLGLLLILTLSMTLGGCFGLKTRDVDLVDANHDAVDALLKRVKKDKFLRYDLVPSKPIIVTSFVNIDDVTRSSTFGRMAGEQVGSRLAQHGYKVVELKLRNDSVFIEKRGGEFILSREVRDLSVEHDAQAVFVGTYARAAERAYITMKALRADDGTILGSHDYSVPLGPNARSMMRSGTRQR